MMFCVVLAAILRGSPRGLAPQDDGEPFRRPVRLNNFPIFRNELDPGRKSPANHCQPVPKEGTLRTSRTSGRVAVDAFVSRDVRHGCVRRSRVVLTPGMLASSP